MWQVIADKNDARRPLLAVAFLIFVISWVAYANPAAGLKYSAGTFGTCTYNACGITLSTSGSVSLDVTPASGSTKCTVSNDVVTATTAASTGYTITMTDTDTTNALAGPASVAASTATPASPTALTANTWGYRVDGIASFGAGPTSPIASAAIPAQTFAGVPLSSGTPGLIRTTSTADSSTVNTSVWYGVCADSSPQAGAYTDDVTYTAVTN